MPVAVALLLTEAMVRSSGGRHQAELMPGVAVEWRGERLSLGFEAEVWHRSQRTELVTLSLTQPRASLIGALHLGDGPLSFVASVGPSAAVRLSTLNGYKGANLLIGGRAGVGVDTTIFGERLSERWTVGLRTGVFAHRFGLEADLGLRTGWQF